MCLLVMNLLLNYKPREDKALCFILYIPFFFFFWSDQFGSVSSSVFWTILSKESEIIDTVITTNNCKSI